MPPFVIEGQKNAITGFLLIIKFLAKIVVKYFVVCGEIG